MANTYRRVVNGLVYYLKLFQCSDGKIYRTRGWAQRHADKYGGIVKEIEPTIPIGNLYFLDLNNIQFNVMKP